MSVLIKSGSSHSCIVTLDLPLALPAGMSTTAILHLMAAGSRRFVVHALLVRGGAHQISSRFHGVALIAIAFFGLHRHCGIGGMRDRAVAIEMDRARLIDVCRYGR